MFSLRLLVHGLPGPPTVLKASTQLLYKLEITVSASLCSRHVACAGFATACTVGSILFD
jgi:hypothetical protein